MEDAAVDPRFQRKNQLDRPRAIFDGHLFHNDSYSKAHTQNRIDVSRKGQGR
jgi:hypothetical protein